MNRPLLGVPVRPTALLLVKDRRLHFDWEVECLSPARQAALLIDLLVKDRRLPCHWEAGWLSTAILLPQSLNS